MIFYILLGLSALLFWRWFGKDSSEPPEIPGKLPFLGHALLLMGDGVELYNAIKKVADESTKLGGVVQFYLGPKKFYGVSNPDDCLTVMNECIQKHYIYDFVRPLFHNGIFNADVPTWKKNRKFLSPAFAQQVLDGFIEIFNTKSSKLVDEFNTEMGRTFDQDKYIRINALDSLCATSLGNVAEFNKNLQETFFPLLQEFESILNVRSKTFWLHSDLLFSFSSLKKRQDEVVSSLNEISDSIIQMKKADMRNASFSHDDSGKLKPFMDLILDLAKDNPTFTDEQVRGETNTVIVGGHDTSASTLSFALAEIGSRPEVQEKAYQEILEILGDTKKDITKDDLSKLEYIEAILKETLRLYSPMPIVSRQLDKDIKLGDFTLRAGNGCLISIYGSHRHAMWGPDANVFRPERWLEKESLPPVKYFAPFGLGRRSCIGKTYAMMSMKITLAHVIRSYLISSDVSKMVVRMDVLIKPEDGFHISLKHR